MGDKYRFINSIIDSLAFYGGNYALDSAAGIGKPKMHHTLLFFVADILVRNGYLTYNAVYDKLPSSTSAVNLKQDSYIAILYFFLSAAYDGVVEKESLKTAIMNNAIRGGIGLGGNVLVDYVVPADYK